MLFKRCYGVRAVFEDYFILTKIERYWGKYGNPQQKGLLPTHMNHF